MVEVRPFEKPVRQVGNRTFHNFEHAGLVDLQSICRDDVLLTGLNMQEVTEGRLEAHIVERSDGVATRDAPCIEYRPLCQLGDTVLTFFVALIALDP